MSDNIGVKICVEVTPTSHTSFDSCVYPWERIEDALNDAKLTLDGADDASVTLKIVKLSQQQIDELQEDQGR